MILKSEESSDFRVRFPVVWHTSLGKQGELLAARSIVPQEGRIVERSSDHLGTSLVSLPDMNGDGRPEVLIGSPRSDRHGNDSGAATMLFSIPAPPRSTLP